MACKYNDSITPNVKESIEDMSNSLNITKPRSYGTSASSDRCSSVLFSSANPRIKVHHVELTDTLQGLSIKYNVSVSSLDILLKINPHFILGLINYFINPISHIFFQHNIQLIRYIIVYPCPVSDLADKISKHVNFKKLFVKCFLTQYFD